MMTNTTAASLPVDPVAAVDHATAMLAALGIHGEDDNTPSRLVRALDELASARTIDPERHLAVTFPPASTGTPGLVAVQKVPFASLCAHHLLPFHGHATVAYLPRPGARIVGLSKLARLVQEHAARPQVQEGLAADVLASIARRLDSRGAAIRIVGQHTCMSLRGARTGAHAAMTTLDHDGVLGQDPWRSEFLAAATGT